MNEPVWLKLARTFLGQREIPGAPTAPFIKAWLAKLHAWWTDDETPWCGVALAAWMDACGIDLPANWMRAKAWLEWGTPLRDPAVGCVVVFNRLGGGHVGLVVGRDVRGRLLVLGGNQGNAVCIAPFTMDRVAGYRWPPVAVPHPLTWLNNLPVVASSAASSTNEA